MNMLKSGKVGISFEHWESRFERNSWLSPSLTPAIHRKAHPTCCLASIPPSCTRGCFRELNSNEMSKEFHTHFQHNFLSALSHSPIFARGSIRLVSQKDKIQSPSPPMWHLQEPCYRRAPSMSRKFTGIASQASKEWVLTAAWVWSIV